MRRLDDHLHYRMIDVSSIKELARRWYPRTYYGQPPRAWRTGRWPTSRRASASSDYYRNTVFVAGPGPDVEAAKAIAAEIAAARPID